MLGYLFLHTIIQFSRNKATDFNHNVINNVALLRAALRRAEDKLPRNAAAQKQNLVEPSGIEPLASCVQSRRSPS
jgi:hypothetical protein